MLLRDVTEFHKLQEERTKVQMMKLLNTSVSHDMMSPIDSIKWFTDQLL